MKNCTYCGKEYPDSATVCDVDGQPLGEPSAPAPAPSRGRRAKEYKRLPGRGMQVEGNRWIAVSRSLCTLWMGSDHLLLVARAGFTENYKRFYFRDIQAITVRKTAKALAGNIVLGILAGGLFLLAVLVPDRIAKVVLALIGGVFVLFLLLNIWRGASCVTHIKTAVQTEQLAAWNRMRATRKGMRMLRPRLIEAQGELPQTELKARLEEQILRQTQSASPQAS